ncbi:UNVERIFIED_CONTAM: hypothetical protein Slati_1360500 [Sesamum latifolium]|uniref:Reverse transcriptase n=1 Tax=Sesamum latifolium TaxID=2727402 RepID=A0AAW2XL22_9LAMI
MLTNIINQTWRLPRSPVDRKEFAHLELSRAGEPLTLKGLADLLKDNKPTLVFLAKTKCFASQIESITLMFLFYLTNPRSGGDFQKSMENETRVRGIAFGDSFIDFTDNQSDIGCALDIILRYLSILKNKQIPNTVRERLDRACASLAWSQLFPDARIQNLTFPFSDHSPILIILKAAPVKDQIIGAFDRGENGKRAEAEKGISQAYYPGRGFLETMKPHPDDIQRGVEHLSAMVDEAMATDLHRSFTEEEVSKLLSCMSSLKSPGPDGLPPLFFQKFWHVMKPDVVDCVLKFLNDHILPVSSNETNIMLIPKNKRPESVAHFRPISF